MSEDVGEHVVAVVVGIPPLRRQPGHVPFPSVGMDFGVVHPVPLAVADVVADFHVLDALGEGQRRRPQRSTRALDRLAAISSRAPASRVALESDGAADVGRVARAAGFLDVAANRVELSAECLDLCLAQMRVLRDVGDGHDVLGSIRRG